MKLLSLVVALVFALCFPLVVLAKPAMNDKLVLMWQVQRDVSDKNLDFLSQEGVNLVQSFGLVKWDDSDIKAYLEKMQKRNIGVIMTIRNFFKKEDGGEDWEGATTFINKWKTHPAVFAWHSFDEATNSNITSLNQENVYKFIKQLDPEHPVFISWNGISEQHYNCCFSERAFDIFDLHVYVRDMPGRRQQNLVDQFVSHRRGSYPLIITLRAFNGTPRPDLPPNGLQAQYDFFFKKNSLTENVGFYGWWLKPNKGITQVPELMRQFQELMF